MALQTQLYGVVGGQEGALIKVPHKEGIIAVAYPLEGPDTYINAGKSVLSRNLELLTAEEIASLLHAVYCGPEEFREQPEVSAIRDIIKNKWLWVPSVRLWTPEGVYVVHDKEAAGLSQPLNVGNLEERLNGGNVVNGIRFSPDESVRFAPRKSYRLEKHTPESLSKDSSIIAEYGLQGAEKLREVSARFIMPPYVYGVNLEKGQKPVQRLSTLYSSLYGHRLGVVGDDCGYFRIGYAFRIREKTGEANCEK